MTKNNFIVITGGPGFGKSTILEALFYDNDCKAFGTAKYYTANAAASLLTTVEDYGNFLAYVLNGAGLPKSTFDEMIKNQVQLKENDYFGLGWEKLTGFSDDEYA